MKDIENVTRYIDVICDILFDELEIAVSGEMLDVLDASRQKVVQANHPMSLCEQAITKV